MLFPSDYCTASRRPFGSFARFEATKFSATRFSATKFAATALSTGGTSLLLQSLLLPTEASAQTINPNLENSLFDPAGGQVTVNRDANTGTVTVERNAYTLETGPLINTSNIPLPAFVPTQTGTGQPIPTVTDGTLAPSNVILGTDLDFIRANFEAVSRDNPNNPFNNANVTYDLEEGSVNVTTEIALERVVGGHQFGEGIEVVVLDENNNVVPDAVITDGNGQAINRVFVRGDEVTIGPQGQVLNSSEVLRVSYAENQRVAVRLLNLSDNNGTVNESGAYFTETGELIAEDLENGGDRDFADGNYLNFSVGQGEAIATAEDTQVTVTTETEETTLDPEIRREEIVVDTPMETVTVSEDVLSETRTYGSVSLSDQQITRLGHARSVRTANDEQTVYSRYAGTSQIRAGSDGLSAAGQLAPLAKNPATPPTLFTGELLFNPFASDNEAGFTATAGITQFVTRTHRSATDMFGNPIAVGEDNSNDNNERPTELLKPALLEPTGWLSNRRLVGYVPEQVEALVEPLKAAERLRSVNGIFYLPSDQTITIDPPDPQTVGLGEAAYTGNVGGLIIEYSDGRLFFQPQWTPNGYAQTPITLSAGEAKRIIYALVPQQPQQSLQLDQPYQLEPSAYPYRLAEGGFRVIAADQQPQNFFQESANVYAVEDTLASGNMITDLFNGIQGEYTEPSGELAMTVDLTIPSEVDARVGNQVYPVETLGQTIRQTTGQRPYAKTTRAAGLYVSGSLTGGIGNQRDRTTRRTTTLITETDQIQTQRISNLFSTPVVQRSQTSFEETTTTLTTGNATFDINRDGLLENAVFNPITTTQGDSTVRNLGTETTLQRGEEILTNTVTTAEVVQTVDTRTEELAADETQETDSYANATPLQGELAVGGVLNFGNTPWTAAANTLRAEIFLRENIVGRGDGSESGWRAALTFHPFGEEQREAYHYDSDGQAVPLYQTVPVLEATGQQRMEKIATADGSVTEVPINQFVLDESGDRIPATVGTGRSRGPGLYVRVQDTWNSRESLTVDGGIQFSF